MKNERLVNSEINSKINEILESEDWDSGLAFIEGLSSNVQKNHWIIANKAIILYEQKKYKEALKEIKKAKSSNPKCPLVMNYYAVIVTMAEGIENGIKLFEEILTIDDEILAFGECGEGMKWTKSLKNDIRYDLALRNFEINQYDKADNYIKEHLNERRQGQYSIVSMKKAKQLALRIESKL